MQVDKIAEKGPKIPLGSDVVSILKAVREHAVKTGREADTAAILFETTLIAHTDSAVIALRKHGATFDNIAHIVLMITACKQHPYWQSYPKSEDIGVTAGIEPQVGNELFLTGRARRVIMFAREETLRDGGIAVSAGRLLRGLVRDGEGVGAAILSYGLGIDLNELYFELGGSAMVAAPQRGLSVETYDEVLPYIPGGDPNFTVVQRIASLPAK